MRDFEIRSIQEIDSVLSTEILYLPVGYSTSTEINVFGVENAHTTRLRASAGKASFTGPVTLFKLHDCIIVDQGIILTSDGYAVAESLVDTKVGLEDRNILVSNNFVRLKNNPKSKIEKGLLLKKRGQTNYGHWLVELLVKQFAVLQSKSTSAPAIVHSALYDYIKNMYSETLSLIGQEKILSIGADPVVVEEIDYVSGLSLHPIMKHPLLIQMAKTMREKAGWIPSMPRRKIFVDRKPSHNRNISNYIDVKNFFYSKGFDFMEPESMSVSEQIVAFASCDAVAGIMGAAMVNSIFSDRTARVGYIAPAVMNGLFYLDQEAVMGRDAFNMLSCKNIGVREPLFDDIFVAAGDLVRWYDRTF